MKVVLASKNQHKLVEISRITEKFGFELVLQSALGVDITGIVALASVVTLAISLALQNSLTNLIGGFTLEVGDYLLDASVRRQIETIRRQFVIQNNRIV